jgi:ATP-dependent DNA helicase RecG
LSPSNSQKINLDSSIEVLFKTKKNKTLENLKQAGIKTVYDLLWVLPLHIEKIPALDNFSKISVGGYFRGFAMIRDVQSRVNPKLKGKGQAPLMNLTVQIKDFYSERFLTLKWFNTYPSTIKKIQQSEHLLFFGKVQTFNNELQIVNPEFQMIAEEDTSKIKIGGESDLKIGYPTVNKTKNGTIKKLIDSLPDELWGQVSDLLSEADLSSNSFIKLSESFKVLHGKSSTKEIDFKMARDRLIFEEFFYEQTKLFIRRKNFKSPSALIIQDSNHEISSLFPFEFTEDQSKVFKDIRKDLSSGHPMMRMVQGDVGCGKTWVAFASCIHAIKEGFQTAIMCPTESLARQHFSEAKKLFTDAGIKVALLLGGMKASEKKKLYEAISIGEIQLVIGTHALIQNDLSFKSLGLAVIDEQHKFGVEQRIKLVEKGKGAHCLIMTATPIPRSLSLSQYGDLDISTIKSLPKNRSGYKTRIVSEETFPKFLSFVKTRLSLNEQVYIVVPAIEESELDINNLKEVFDKFKKFFPESEICPLHGKLTPEEKEQSFLKFKEGKIDVLIATSVVEVGINVTNATIMAILNPERFGLSSLHQLRGRVGRGEKTGFCFLVAENKISKEAMARLEFIEQTSDGFSIAEEDLRIRGQGDLLGKNQSGSDGFKKIANPIAHYSLLLKAREFLLKISESNTMEFQDYLKKASKDVLVHTTI